MIVVVVGGSEKSLFLVERASFTSCSFNRRDLRAMNR